MVKLNRGAVEVFYEESKAASNGLDSILDDYRANTTKILALATGAAAFFGFEDSDKGWAFFGALGLYGVAVLLALAIYWPRAWRADAASGVEKLLANPPGGATAVTETKLRFDLAVRYQSFFRSNNQQLQGWKGVPSLYSALVVLTAGVVLLGGLNAAVNPKESDDRPTRVEIVRGEQKDKSNG